MQGSGSSDWEEYEEEDWGYGGDPARPQAGGTMMGRGKRRGSSESEYDVATTVQRRPSSLGGGLPDSCPPAAKR